MTAAEKMPTILKVEPLARARLRLHWSKGEPVQLDLAGWLEDPAFAPLRDPQEFSRVELGDWGHSLAWPSGVEIGADSLWLETLTARKRDDARVFLEWRLKHGLSLTKAAEALGLSRRMVAYYSSAEKPVPRTVLLACRGWEVGQPVSSAPRGAGRIPAPAAE